jgi:proteasome lid subunit RPN8/RPN11
VAGVNLPARVARAILAHARASAPEECCGLLIGDARSIVRVHPARNISPAPRRRYLVSPADHFAAIRAARRDGLVVVGAYHSHPAGPATPSPTDVSHADAPDWLHVIVAGHGDVLRAWRIERRNFTEIPLVRNTENTKEPGNTKGTKGTNTKGTRDTMGPPPRAKPMADSIR